MTRRTSTTITTTYRVTTDILPKNLDGTVLLLIKFEDKHIICFTPTVEVLAQQLEADVLRIPLCNSSSAFSL
jgi:hypothetical protein